MQLEETIAQWIQIQRLGSGVSIRMQAEIDKAFKEIEKVFKRKGTVKSQKKAIKSILDAYSPSIATTLVQQMQSIGTYAQDVAIAGLIESSVVGAEGMVSVLVDKPFVSKVLNAKGSKTNDMLRAMHTTNRRGLAQVVAKTFTKGLSVAETSKLLLGVSAKTKQHADVIARTSINAVSNESYKQLYKNNRSVVDRMMVSATLDSRTSAICQQMDGTVWKVEDAESPPYHPNCRTLLVPVFVNESIKQANERLTPKTSVVPKSAKAIQDKGIKTSGGKARKPNISKNKGDSPLYRKATNAPNYEHWLRTQPKAYQSQILGKKATTKFRDGQRLSTVLSNKKSAITVERLKKKAVNKQSRVGSAATI